MAPFAESYWLTIVTLCQQPSDQEVQGTCVWVGGCCYDAVPPLEREFLKQLRDKMLDKTQRGVLHYGK